MTDPPFGFGLPGDRDRGPDGPGGGAGGTGGSGSAGGPGGPGMPPGGMGPLGPMGDPQQFADALRQFADLMSWQGGPVNWDLAKNVARQAVDRKSTRLNSSHVRISYAVFCLKKKKKKE